jgi:hypothetical protein
MYLLATFAQRYDRLRREAYGTDLDYASIIEAVSLSVIEARMRDPNWRQEYSAISKTVGATPQRGVNSMSISRATGIPRETARRKIKNLIARGALTEVRAGEYIVTPGYLQKVATAARVEGALADALRFMNDGLEHGVWSTSEE